jgi:hypothetical protein
VAPYAPKIGIPLIAAGTILLFIRRGLVGALAPPLLVITAVKNPTLALSIVKEIADTLGGGAKEAVKLGFQVSGLLVTSAGVVVGLVLPKKMISRVHIIEKKNKMDFNFFPNVRLGDEPFVGIFCSAKGSGKTTLLLDILKSIWKNVFNLIVIVSPTFSLQSLSHEIDGRGVIVFSEFRQCIITEISELQEEKINEKEEIQERLRHPELLTFRDPKSPPEDHHVLLIFDDIGSFGREGKLGIQLADLSL